MKYLHAEWWYWHVGWYKRWLDFMYMRFYGFTWEEACDLFEKIRLPDQKPLGKYRR